MLSDRELQAQHYWRTMQNGISTEGAAEFRDELDGLAFHTTSPVLRELCARNRRRYDGHINLQLLANGRCSKVLRALATTTR